MEHIRCVVERITYQNEQNGYSVIKCRAKGWDDLAAQSVTRCRLCFLFSL